MIKQENLTKEYAIFIHEHFEGTMFAFAPFLGIWFDDKEIKYIETKMETHKNYRLVSGKAAGLHWRDPRLFDFQRLWLTGFLDDPTAPVGVKAFIVYYIGHEWACMKINDQYDNLQRYKNSLTHEFLAQRWMETCR